MVLTIVINVEMNYTMPNFLLSIVGPTAIGKTALSIKLAKHFNSEIISADSRQFYQEMSIGTAVPSKEELSEAPHHFIQHKSIEESFNVGEFEREAISKIAKLHLKKLRIVNTPEMNRRRNFKQSIEDTLVKAPQIIR